MNLKALGENQCLGIYHSVLQRAELLPYIYHERSSSPISDDWGHHAINNLLQRAAFRPHDLALIACDSHPEPDEHDADDDDDDDDNEAVDEEKWLTQDRRNEAWKCHAPSRYTTPTVMKKTAGKYHIFFNSSSDFEVYKRHPEVLDAFMLTNESHWITIRCTLSRWIFPWLRRFGSSEWFYNLDSRLPQPGLIPRTELRQTLRMAKAIGYTVFVCEPTLGSGFPPCGGGQASTSNLNWMGRLPGSTSTSHNTLAMNGHLDPNLDPQPNDPRRSTTSSNGKGKRRMIDEEDLTDEDGNDDDVIIDDGDADEDDDVIIVEDSDRQNGGGGRMNPSTKRTRGGEAKRKKRRSDYGEGVGGGVGDDGSSSTPPTNMASTSNSSVSAAPTRKETSEEAQMSRAITESMKAARANSTSTSTSNQSPGPNSETTEDLELQRALKASLLDDVEVDEDDHALDDTPSMEELRRRRMNRFALR
ncbi:BQ5605_C037g11590 [Microbotryum silenes-dioicae]|uniref:ubiquitinyl hydrolase 1 n=1 Tax=Microbotryum silenes-dioicae TaxID=796604 RepID=A0A2X0MJ56_9BASI|nr:BQ5605_C037g11590 [Microbotryum silenes-dioicae]